MPLENKDDDRSSVDAEPIRAWLQPTDYESKGSGYRAHLSLHLPGTGQWLFESEVYQKWKNVPGNDILWIRGIPGSGKSVLAAKVVREVSQTGDLVMFFFFSRNLDGNCRPESVVRDWVSQLLKYKPSLTHVIDKERETFDSMQKLSFNHLKEILWEALEGLEKAYFIVDALDEMDDNCLEGFVQFLTDLSKRPSSIKIVVTSRPLPSIEALLKIPKTLDIQLDRHQMEQDLNIHVQHRLSHTTLPAESKPVIAKKILDNADGLFLYAKLVIDRLSTDEDVTVEKIVQTIPDDLTAMCSSMLQEETIRAGDLASLQQFILQCVVFSIRPLRLIELADLLKTTQNMVEDLGQLKAMIRSLCGPLLGVLPDESLRIVHHSLTEYLSGAVIGPASDTRSLILTPGVCHSRMTALCLSYLQSGCLDHEAIHYSITGDWYNIRQWLAPTLPPFMNYAQRNWHVHYRKAYLADADQAEEHAELLKIVASHNMSKLGLLAEIPTGNHALLFVTAFELQGFVKQLSSLESSQYVTEDKPRELPLQLAARTGKEVMVKLLLDHGAHPDEYDERSGTTALHWAVHHHHQGIVTQLLQAGANPYLPTKVGTQYSTEKLGEEEVLAYHQAFWGAFGRGDAAMIQLFLPHLQQPDKIISALNCVGYRNGSSDQPVAPLLEIVLQDVKSKVETSLISDTLNELLQNSCKRRDADTISLLLKAGADPNAYPTHAVRLPNSNQWPNALHTLANHNPPDSGTTEEQSLRSFKLILAAGCDIHQRDSYGRTPLLASTDLVAVRCLLEAGSDLNATDSAGNTLIHITTDSEIIKYLSEKTAALSTKDSNGRTLLLSTILKAAISDPSAIRNAIQLINWGADVSITDSNGDTALHYAVKVRYGDQDMPDLVARICSSKGVDVNARNKKGQTPLVAATSAPPLEVSEAAIDKAIQILLEAGADPNIKDDLGRTPLWTLLQSGFGLNRYEPVQRAKDPPREKTSILERLVAAGARLDVTDSSGRTLLHAAATDWDDETIRYLIQHGVDPHQPDNSGRSMFHDGVFHQGSNPDAASKMYASAMALGIDVERPNRDGHTPLHLLNTFEPKSSTGRNDGKESLFDFLAARSRYTNHQDRDGLTPLHFASAFSAHYTKRLLEVGADVSKVSNEGWSVLHIAARSQQVNVLGILLDHMRATLSVDQVRAILEARDICNRTAVYYACASGRVEALQVLIEAGAVIDADAYEGSAWNGCADFEAEQALRVQSHPQPVNEYVLEPQRGMVRIAGRTRPEPKKYEYYPAPPSERVDEILDLLVIHGPTFGKQHVEKAIASAVERGFDYTVKCLLRAGNALDIHVPDKIRGRVDDCLSRLRQRTISILDNPENTEEYEIFQQLLGIRDYDAVLERCQTSVLKRKSTQWDDSPSPMHRLVEGGYAFLIRRFATPEFIAEARNLFVRDPKQYCDIDSLILVACTRELPNMNVVRTLVEIGGLSPIYIPISVDARELAIRQFQTENPLQVLCQKAHWWQIARAIPYLVGHGADINAVDEMGFTPLDALLNQVHGSGIDLETIRTLLRCGANAEPCLALAGNNTKLFQLLVEHGATVTVAAVDEVIWHKDYDRLEMILRSGFDPNTRTVNPKRLLNSQFYGGSEPRPDIMFPLHYLLTLIITGSPPSSQQDNNNSQQASQTIQHRMLNLLLDHGANPFAPYELTTIFHHCLIIPEGDRTTIRQNMFDQLLLPRSVLPACNLEATDSEGMTIFLLACRRKIDHNDSWLLRKLIDRGANVRARDRQGRTALHHLLSARHIMLWARVKPELESRREDVELVLLHAPELIGVVDEGGQTVFHVAAEYPDDAIEILLHAAATTTATTATTTGNNAMNLPNMLNHQDNTGTTPLSILLAAAKPFSTGWLLDQNNQLSPPQRIQAINSLISNGAQVNLRNKDGETPIFAYFRHGLFSTHDDAAGEMQGGAGAEGMSRDSDGTMEMRTQQSDVLPREKPLWDLFDQFGVDWGVVNASGEGLLHVVAGANKNETGRRKRERFMFLVQEKGLDPRRVDVSGRSALDVAAASGAVEILDMFRRDS